MSVRREAGPGRAALEKALRTMDQTVGKVGWFSNSRYPENGPPVAYVAAIHEHGYPEGNIPPRLGMRSVNADQKSKWAALSDKLAAEVIAGKRTPESMMDLIGQVAGGDYKKHIAGPISPALKPATVEARLRRYASVSKKSISVSVSHPLTDTKLLFNTLTNTVGKDDGE